VIQIRHQMRCRAWLNGRYCKNNTKATFCHVHRHLCEYPALIQKIPGIALEKIADNLKTDINLQHFRLTCKVIHGSIKRLPFQLSSEFKYFKRFYSQTDLTVRQVVNASERYERLNTKQQDLLKTIPRYGRSIQARTHTDTVTFNMHMHAFNRLMSTKSESMVACGL
jgi:hypothetical protein